MAASACCLYAIDEETLVSCIDITDRAHRSKIMLLDDVVADGCHDRFTNCDIYIYMNTLRMYHNVCPTTVGRTENNTSVFSKESAALHYISSNKFLHYLFATTFYDLSQSNLLVLFRHIFLGQKLNNSFGQCSRYFSFSNNSTNST